MSASRPKDDFQMSIQALYDIKEALLHPHRTGGQSKRPQDLREIELGMTNFDHTIDVGLEAALRAGGVYGRHAAWNFNGQVWFADGMFHEEVWVYKEPQGTISAPTLEELMAAVNAKYGDE